MSILILQRKNLSRRRHLERARSYATQHGERLLLMMKDPTWEAEFVDRVVAADTSDLAETETAVKRLVHDEDEPIRAVVTFTDSGVPMAARVAAVLGLPAVSERTAYLARDKFAMRRAAAEGGVAQPAFDLARTVDEAKEKAARIGYPLILKPFIGYGSMYVRRIDDERDLEEHFEALRTGAWEGFDYDPLYEEAVRLYEGALLLEEFVPGAEVSVESLIVDGTTRVIAVHDKPLPTGPTFEEVYACTPTRLPAHVVERLEEATARVHEALGIRTGGSHVEFRLRGEEPVLLEAAARLGGGPICRSVQLSTGVDMVGAVLDLACGRTPRIEPAERTTHVGFWNIFPADPGFLAGVDGLDRAVEDPRVDEIQIYREPGEFLDVPPRTFQSHGHLIFQVDAAEDLDGTFEELVRTVRLRTRP
ncbi:ATP-grasp domain-containing protein [Streptomyces sp. NPDC014746]|uniref:ATP-grasp domain-containing protein n=1 Tax=Streptomyces sp. NPDC014746 TaxID=3364904 RepID=UPI0036FBAA9A